MPALTTLTAAGVPGRRKAFGPKIPTEPAGGRPSAPRFTRLSAAGTPERFRVRAAKSQSWDVIVGGPLPRLGGSVAALIGGAVVFEIRLDIEFEPTLGPYFGANLAGSLPKLASSLAGTAASSISATLAGSLPKLAGAVVGTFDLNTSAVLAGELPKLAGAFAATGQGYEAAVGGPLPKLTGSIAGTHIGLYAGPLLATLPRIGGSLAALYTPASIDAVLSGGLPRLGGEISSSFDIPGRTAVLQAVLPALVGQFREAPAVVLVTRITLEGRVIDT